MTTKQKLLERIHQLEQKIQIVERQIKIQQLEAKYIAIKKLEEQAQNEDSNGITIYRQYFTHHIQTSQVVKVTAKFFLYIPKNSDVWVYGLPGYLPSLEARTGSGEELPILSDHELNILFTNENADFVTQESLQQLYNEQIRIIEHSVRHVENDGKHYPSNRYPLDSANRNVRHVENDGKHYVGIIIPQYDFNHFQEIILKWTEEIPQNNVETFAFDISVTRHHVISPTTDASTYLSVSMDPKKYEFLEDPIITARNHDGNIKVGEGNHYQKILSNKSEHVLRIKRHSLFTFNIKYSIGIPKFFRQWAWAGFLIAVPVIFYSLFSFLFDKTLYDDNSKLLAGLIALLVGFRVLLFHDTELLSRWNRAYLILLGISVFLIIIFQSSQFI